MKLEALFALIVIALNVPVTDQSRANRSVWPPGPTYTLAQPKTSSWPAATWNDAPAPDDQARHLDWLDDSDEDEPSDDKGVIDTILEDGDDDAKVERTDDELRQRRRRYERVHRVMMPMLLMYKLKYFTMIPLLVGALVLLVYTTALAGFFFALFAAAASK